tara:strand:+ start:384 stop:749 length:366 start_codon:yes stop_codon:yes gene_type:complete
MPFSINLTDRIAECDVSIYQHNLGVGLADKDRTELLKNELSLIKTERLIYTALLNPNGNKKIYKILFAKWEELTGLSYELGRDLVGIGIITEGKYIEYCKDSLKDREKMRICCSMGYGEPL